MATSEGNTFTTYQRLSAAIGQACSNFWFYFKPQAQNEGLSLYIKQKDTGEWVAVAKRWDDEKRSLVVAFGNGFDLVGALMALNASITKERWFPDRQQASPRQLPPTQE